MRTAGLLMMDTPMPDGRIFVPPTAFAGGGTVTLAGGMVELAVTGALVNLTAAPSLLMRYGMSDDAQQNYGMGAPGSQGFQGAQAQKVATGQPFTTPYGQSGRPPQPSATFGQPVIRPKGLKPVAVTVAYSVTGGALTAATVQLSKTNLTVGVAPAPATILAPTALQLAAAQTDIITTPIPVANQQWLNDFFDVLTLIIAVNAGAATMTLYGAYIDVAFNFN